jgi:hypothetical protein
MGLVLEVLIYLRLSHNPYGFTGPHEFRMGADPAGKLPEPGSADQRAIFLAHCQHGHFDTFFRVLDFNLDLGLPECRMSFSDKVGQKKDEKRTA